MNIHAYIVGALVALLSFAPMQVSGAESDLFHWEQSGIGGDPCNPKAGCTLAWALKQSDWPTYVTWALKKVVLNGPARRTEVCSGWRGWMTWGKYSPKFRKSVLADWKVGHCEPALLWSAVTQEAIYHVVQINACSNWGGWTEPKEARVSSLPTKSTEPTPEAPPLGVIPVTYCP